MDVSLVGPMTAEAIVRMKPLARASRRAEDHDWCALVERFCEGERRPLLDEFESQFIQWTGLWVALTQIRLFDSSGGESRAWDQLDSYRLVELDERLSFAHQQIEDMRDALLHRIRLVAVQPTDRVLARRVRQTAVHLLDRARYLENIQRDPALAGAHEEIVAEARAATKLRHDAYSDIAWLLVGCEEDVKRLRADQPDVRPDARAIGVVRLGAWAKRLELHEDDALPLLGAVEKFVHAVIDSPEAPTSARKRGRPPKRDPWARRREARLELITEIAVASGVSASPESIDRQMRNAEARARNELMARDERKRM